MSEWLKAAMMTSLNAKQRVECASLRYARDGRRWIKKGRLAHLGIAQAFLIGFGSLGKTGFGHNKTSKNEQHYREI
jgi:hypothetical protein